MRWMQNRIVAVIVCMALVFSLVPIGAIKSALAAANSYFIITSFSTDVNNPTTVNTQKVDITGTFNSQVVGNSISYQIQQIVNGQAVNTATSTQSAIITQQNFVFKGVQLYPGLNKIIILGKNTSGNMVQTVDSSGSSTNECAYVTYANVPIIYNVQQIDGTPYNGTVYIDQASSGKSTLSFTFHAPNADQTSINGVLGVPGGGDLWIASNIALNSGSNTISIVAKNSSQSYTVTRQAVLFNGQSSFGLTADPDVSKGGTQRQSFDGNPVLGPTAQSPYSFTGSIQGNFILTNSKTVTSDVYVQLDLIDPSGNVLNTNNPTFSISSTINGGANTVYSFTSSALLSGQTITPGLQYTVRTTVHYKAGITPQVNTYTFTYRDPSSVYMIESDLLYGVTNVSPSVFNYTSKSITSSSFDVLTSPLTLGFVLGNWSSTSPNPTVTVTDTQNGTTTAVTVTTGKTFDGSMYVLQIPGSQLFSGLQTLNVTIGADTRTFTINYVPAPTIQLTNLYNGQVFNSIGGLPAITARFTNFTNTEVQATKVYVNQTEVTAAMSTWVYDSTTNLYSKLLTGITLQPGANTILIHGVANGIPIDINLTVYVFSTDVPVITEPIPMDSTFSNQNTVTVQRTGDIKFSTSDQDTYFRIPYSNMDNIKILLDGQQVFADYVSATTPNTYFDASGTTTSTANNWMQVVSSTETRLKLHLKQSGSTNVTVMGTRNGVPVSMTFEVNRQVPPYQIISPVLPDQRVINQNFWPIQIKAEMADSIVINKDKASPVLGQPGYFSYEIKGLKPGKNTIKFTVNRAGAPITGSFDLYFANQNTIGAQYKTPLNGSSLSAFNKAVTITFPKNTLFRNDLGVNGTDNSVPNLFDQQQVRFGIASQADATVSPVSGITTTGKSLVIDSLNDGQYIFAGPLFWVDAGYYDNTSSVYKPVDGLDPYATGNEFYNGRKWLKPTNRGQVSIQYDEALRDVAGNNLSIWRFSNNKWEDIGGVVDTNKHTITAEFDQFGYYTVMMLRKGYTDITGHPWAREYLETMMSKGIMLPKSKDEFGVYDLINRGEFAEVMVKALDLPLDYQNNNLTYYDVPNVIVPGQLYDYRYIETAFRKGIVKGLSPGVFNPTGNLSRQDAAVMIARAINAKVGRDGVAAQKAMSKIFTDSTLIDTYSSPSVLAINKIGIINGQPNDLLQGQKKQTFSFNPSAPLSRAEAAKIAYATMQYLKKLPK